MKNVTVQIRNCWQFKRCNIISLKKSYNINLTSCWRCKVSSLTVVFSKMILNDAVNGKVRALLFSKVVKIQRLLKTCHMFFFFRILVLNIRNLDISSFQVEWNSKKENLTPSFRARRKKKISSSKIMMDLILKTFFMFLHTFEFR